ncbi:MAG TPA: DUF108 domain-containing protein [Burkholderiaceae bacterium]|nr:DUF108 domain-containing protein [Burkholderiaceae bacterium]
MRRVRQQADDGRRSRSSDADGSMMEQTVQPPRRFGLIGRGRIGGAVIDAWRSGALPEWQLSAVLARGSRSAATAADARDGGVVARGGGIVARGGDIDAPGDDTSASALARSDTGIPLVDDIDALLRSGCDLVVEAAGAQAFAAHACRVLEVCDLWAVSPTPLADPVLQSVVEATARRSGRRLRILSGAIAGLDGVAMICVDDDAQLQLTIDLPPAAAAPGIASHGIGSPGASLPGGGPHADGPNGHGPHRVVFRGTVREAARRFPDAVNVAVAAALAGPGLDRARIEVLCPESRDRHRLALRATGRYGSVEVAVHPRVAPGVHPVAASIVAALREAGRAIRAGA